MYDYQYLLDCTKKDFQTMGCSREHSEIITECVPCVELKQKFEYIWINKYIMGMKFWIYTLMIFLLLKSNIKAQECKIPSTGNYKNSINAYIGLFEYNLNYERTVFIFPRSYSNIRTGFGQMNNLQATGNVFNLTFVHILGRHASHLEFNIGAKYINVTSDKDQSTFYPDLFLGYRFEKPESRFIFRAGLSALSIINVGTGVKF